MSKEYLDFECEIKAVDDEEGIIEGWGSIFDKEPDSYGDIVARGAFEESIVNGGRNRNHKIPILNQHRSEQPIGLWDTLEERRKGLYVKGKLNMELPLAKEVYSNIKFKAISGLSIGYTVQDYKIEQQEKREYRVLTKVDLWEISPVTFPAKVTAQIGLVKSIKEAGSPREIERILRDEGLSKSSSAWIANQLIKSKREAGSDEIELKFLKEVRDSLKQL